MADVSGFAERVVDADFVNAHSNACVEWMRANHPRRCSDDDDGAVDGDDDGAVVAKGVTDAMGRGPWATKSASS